MIDIKQFDKFYCLTPIPGTLLNKEMNEIG